MPCGMAVGVLHEMRRRQPRYRAGREIHLPPHTGLEQVKRQRITQLRQCVIFHGEAVAVGVAQGFHGLEAVGKQVKLPCDRLPGSK